MKEANNIDDYLSQLPEADRKELQRIRTLIVAAIPNAEETISYGMPTFKYKGKNVIHIAAFKDHLSIFPTAEPIEELKDQLEPFATGRGTLQFTIDKPVPDDVIKQLISIRLATIDGA